MKLNKYRLGDFFELYSEKCNIPNLTEEDVSGINRDKEFFEPSHQVGSNTTNYKIVPPRYFACNLMHVGRDKVLPIAYNHTQKNKIVSPAYFVFRIIENDFLDELYFFMMLKSEERDRYFWFHTDASVRDGMSWDDLCGVEIELPTKPIQQKYVNIYKAMLKNQESYEKGLNDLKIVYESTIEELRKEFKLFPIGNFTKSYKEINKDLKCTKLAGLIDGKIEDARKASGQENLKKFQIIYPGSIVYPPPHFGEVGTIGIVENEPVLMSPMYVTFKVNDENQLNPIYLLMWLRRKEFKRYGFFASDDSIRDTFGYDKLSEYKIPVPPIETQNTIALIYKNYNTRRSINENLKQQIKVICPILIKGSLQDY